MPDLTSMQVLVEVVGLPGQQELVVRQVAAVHLNDGVLGQRDRVVLGLGDLQRLPFDGVEAQRSLALLGGLLRGLQLVDPQRSEHRPGNPAGVALEVGALSENQNPPSRGKESDMAGTATLSAASMETLSLLRSEGALSVSEIAARLDLRVLTTRQRLARLRLLGLAEVAMPGFGRAYQSWTLTPAGEEVLACAS